MDPERRTILVIEDDQDVREIIVELLEDHGYSVAGAPDGAAALRLLSGGAPPALILLDLMMPTMDGVEFRDAQLRDPRLAEVPVMLLSADESIEDSALALGSAGFIKKPVMLRTLLETAERFAGAPRAPDGGGC